MIWLVWRRQRAALLFALGLCVVVAVTVVAGRYVLVEVGRGLGVLPCLRGARTGVCGTGVWYDYSSAVRVLGGGTMAAALALPAVAGIAAGAGLFGRELDRGTHVFALNQHASRLRWWVTGLLVAGLPVTAAVAVAGLAARFAVRPFGSLVVTSPMSDFEFLTSGVLPTVYTLLAFTLAAAAGLVLRNALPAIAVAAVLQLVVLAVLGLGLRTSYLPPLTVVTSVSGPSPFAPPDARQVSFGYLDAQGREVDPRIVVIPPDCDPGPYGDYADCLRATGITDQFVDDQPAARYWPFQAIESAVVLALVASTLGVGLWGLRRRVH